MLQAITHNYHNHSDNTQNFRFKNLQEIDTKKLIQNLIQNSDSNETITPDFVHCFCVNITLSSLDLDDQS